MNHWQVLNAWVPLDAEIFTLPAHELAPLRKYFDNLPGDEQVTAMSSS